MRPFSTISFDSWARMDSNHRTPKRTDLQSVAVGHLATCPAMFRGIPRRIFSQRTTAASPNFLKRLSPFPVSQRRDSNPRPADYKSAALPTELLWLVLNFVGPA